LAVKVVSAKQEKNMIFDVNIQPKNSVDIEFEAEIHFSERQDFFNVESVRFYQPKGEGAYITADDDCAVCRTLYHAVVGYCNDHEAEVFERAIELGDVRKWPEHLS
jgi:hypothetical protein